MSPSLQCSFFKITSKNAIRCLPYVDKEVSLQTNPSPTCKIKFDSSKLSNPFVRRSHGYAIVYFYKSYDTFLSPIKVKAFLKCQMKNILAVS